MREAVKVSQRFAGAARPLPERRDRGRRRLRLPTARRVFIGGIMEHIEQAGVHSGDSACSLPPYSLSQETSDELQAPDRGDGQGAERGRPDERAVRDPGEGRQGRDLRAGSESARLAHRAFRVSKATGMPLAKIAARCMVGQSLASAGHHQGSDAAVLQREGSGVPVHQVPGRGHHPRPGDEVHRRSDGRGQDLRRGLREVAAGRGHAGCRTAGKVFLSVQEQRQAARRRGRARAGRAGLRAGRHQGHGGGHRRRRASPARRSTRWPKAGRTSST